LAYGRTYKLPVLISRCSNNYGTHQFAEKLIPFFVRKIASGEKAPLYGDGKNAREWIWVEDHCSALLTILEKGVLGEVYNVGSDEERSNREIYELICEALGADKQTSYEFVEDRKGHDRRYAIDSTKLRELDWKPIAGFEEELKKTVLFYKNKFQV
jgi:dTDP-glucose 4,6-dehydratase